MFQENAHNSSQVTRTGTKTSANLQVSGNRRERQALADVMESRVANMKAPGLTEGPKAKGKPKHKKETRGIVCIQLMH